VSDEKKHKVAGSRLSLGSGLPWPVVEKNAGGGRGDTKPKESKIIVEYQI